MPLIKIDLQNLHLHVHGDTSNTGDIAAELIKLKQFMGQNFDDLKALLVAANEKITTAATGLQADIAQLKQLITDATVNGATPEQLAELKATADLISAKVDALAALDAETTQS